jgi:hypothetical protein
MMGSILTNHHTFYIEGDKRKFEKVFKLKEIVKKKTQV